MKLKQLVMCADPEYHAAHIYESVGFKPGKPNMVCTGGKGIENEPART